MTLDSTLLALPLQLATVKRTLLRRYVLLHISFIGSMLF